MALMKRLASLFISLGIVGALAAQLEPSGLRLRVELSDGSRIVGQPVSFEGSCAAGEASIAIGIALSEEGDFLRLEFAAFDQIKGST